MAIIGKILFPFKKHWSHLKDFWWHRLVVVIFHITLVFTLFGTWFCQNISEYDQTLCINTAHQTNLPFGLGSYYCVHQVVHVWINLIHSLILMILMSYILQLFYYKILLFIIFGNKK